MAARAIEVESCDGDHGDYINIIQFMEKNQENIHAFYTDWQEILKRREIKELIRTKCDEWFTKCYRSSRLQKDRKPMADEGEEKLYQEFIEKLSNIGENPDIQFFDRINLDTAKKTIEENYSHSDWIKNVMACLEQEQNLIKKYCRVNQQEANLEANKKMNNTILNIEDLQKEIQDLQQTLEMAIEDLEALCEDMEQKQENKQNWSMVKDWQEEKHNNGEMEDGEDIQISQDNMKTLEITLQEQQPQLEKKLQKIVTIRQTLINQYQTITSNLHSLVQELLQEVSAWQTEFKHQYVEIYATPDLDRIAPWCAKVGRILYQMCYKDLLTWLNLLNRLVMSSVPVQEDNDCLQQIHAQTSALFKEMLQGTFLVTEQDNYIVKVEKKHNIPKMTVRILAADSLGLKGESVEAYFILESDINDCFYNNQFDLQKLKDKSKQLVPNSVKFTTIKGKYEGNISKFKTGGKFERSSNGNKLLVHEEKYRVLFLTKIEGECLWTLSLPLVVTTGANQSCCALASVMWQCFSTDPYLLPIEIKPFLPWSKVAQMLDAKIMKLCPTKKLTEDNIAHLKSRLLGPDCASLDDEHKVDLNLFCSEKMLHPHKKDDTCSFSFWKWFLANYNLLDKYLLDYWKDGLIEGFISKPTVVQNLGQCNDTGTFLLRFSDTNIKDSQGVGSVFGYISGTVMTVNEDKGEKKKFVHHITTLGHKCFEDKNLATHLKNGIDKNHQPIYLHIYPGDRKREDTFDKYAKNGTTVDGYVGIKDATIIDLQQEMAAYSVSTGKHRSPSSDSGFDPASPLSICSQGGGKRQRTTVGDSCSTIVNMLKTSALGNQRESLHNHARSSDTWSNCSTGQSPAHAMGSPSGMDANSLHGHPNNHHIFLNQLNSSMAVNQEVNSQHSGNGFMGNDFSGQLNFPTIVQDINLNNPGLSPSNYGLQYPASFTTVGSPSNNGMQMQHSATQQAEPEVIVVSSNRNPQQLEQMTAMMNQLQYLPVNVLEKFATLANSLLQQAQTNQRQQFANIASPTSQMPNIASPDMVVTEMDNNLGDILTSGSGSGGLSLLLDAGVEEMNSGDINIEIFESLL